MNEVDRVALGYVAGMLDGEGSIRRQWYKATKNGRQYQRTVLSIYNTNRDALDFIAKTVGAGGVGLHRSAQTAKGWKAVYAYRASNAVADMLLLTLLPYLIIKREAALAILRSSVGDPYKPSRTLEGLDGSIFQKFIRADQANPVEAPL